LKQVALWRECLPRIQPFYAVKSNPDPVILKWMNSTGLLKVDCASPGEMRLVKSAGFKSSNILYANTMKSDADLEEAMGHEFSATTTDSVEGVVQLAAAFKSSEPKPIIVRLAVDDRQSRSPFSIKFGAQEEEWLKIMNAIKARGLTFGGLSFHVGSASSDPDSFVKAIRQCRRFQQRIGCDLDVVDIGGGFLPYENSFRQVADGICREMDDWSDGGPKQWIAEPGRFFSSPLQTLLCPIVFKKESVDRVRYMLDDSVYGQFSSILFDHSKPHWSVISNRNLVRTDKQALFFGKTCDSLDLIAVQKRAPEYEVGDIFVFPNMGAYTSASATTFNGFALPQKYYIENPSLQKLFEGQEEQPGVEFPIETKSRISLSAQI
jgi:ornithine decarboxylase